MIETPRYQHDCESCIFLGAYTGDSGTEYDLYWCDQGGFMPTVIARYSDDGPDYNSGYAFVGIIDPIDEAAKRAAERGLPSKPKECSLV